MTAADEPRHARPARRTADAAGARAVVAAGSSASAPGSSSALVAWLLVRQARTIDWSEVLDVGRRDPAADAARGRRRWPPAAIALYSCYDLLGRRMTGHKLGTGTVMGVTFISYAFNLNLGSLVGGVAFRYRLYSRLGLDNNTITRVLGFSMLTNWLGYLVRRGRGLLLLADGAAARLEDRQRRPAHPRRRAAGLAARPTWRCARSRASTPGTSAATSWTRRRCAWRCCSWLMSCVNWSLIGGVIWFLLQRAGALPARARRAAGGRRGRRHHARAGRPGRARSGVRRAALAPGAARPAARRAAGLPRHLLPDAAGHRDSGVRGDGNARQAACAAQPRNRSRHTAFASLYIHTVDLQRKLAILADAAKYDASCASSGTRKRDSLGGKRHRLDRGLGHLPQLCARRPLHLAAEDPAHQLLHLRLPLLRQPRHEQRAARALHGRRSGAAHARLLPPQLHRGPVPQLGDHPHRPTTRWSRWSRSRACCARSTTSAATST